METPLHIPKHTLNIARADMPQVGHDYHGFLKSLRNKGISVRKEKVYPGELKATQGEFNHAGIRHLMKDKPKLKPTIISNDSYILDGHHRWLADLNSNPQEKIDVVRVDTGILELLKHAKLHPGTKFRGVNDIIKRIVKESLHLRSLGL